MKHIRNAEVIEPQVVWNNFDILCGLPRPSKHEDKVVQFLLDFGKEHGLETIKDKIGNVIIKKPASSEELKGAPTVVLQSHIDMVPTKRDDIEHDFTTDPIDAFLEDGWVKAEGTTLGADNGIGASMMMAVLESRDLVHGPIEAFFTIDEETGMTGVTYMEPELLTGEILLNLDSEDWGDIFVGCAGGVDFTTNFEYGSQKPAYDMAYTVKLSGLPGGHSGLTIHEGRGNSIKTMARILWMIGKQMDFQLANITGGTLINVIPSRASATVVIPKESRKKFIETLSEISEVIKKEFHVIAPELKIEASPVELPEDCMADETKAGIIAALYISPNGVERMTDGMPELVETSSNIGVLRSDKGKVTVKGMIRSSSNTARDDLTSRINALFSMLGATDFVEANHFPGWLPDLENELLDKTLATYEKQFGIKPNVISIHAGLECALIGDKCPGMKMVSFGPTILGAHSVKERCEVASTAKCWEFLKRLLSELAAV